MFSTSMEMRGPSPNMACNVFLHYQSHVMRRRTFVTLPFSISPLGVSCTNTSSNSSS